MKIKLYSDSCQLIEDPVNPKWDKLCLYAFAGLLPAELLGWLKVNPRGQDMKRGNVKEIKESLRINDHFHVLNRGICMNVAGYSYDRATGYLVLEVTDKAIHGVIDGAHSLRTILEAGALPDNRFISFEIFKVGAEDIRQLARARNATVEVDLRSLANVEQEFASLQEFLAPLPFAGRIRYRSNEEDKDIDVQDVLSVLFTFCDKVFPVGDDYLIRHKRPEEALKLYLSMTREQREETLRPMAPILTDIFALWDRIELEFVRKMPRNKRNGELLVKSLNYMTGHGSKVKERKGGTTTLFSRTLTLYWVSVDIIRPLFASHAALVQIGADGVYGWKANPLEAWEKYAQGAVADLIADKAPVKSNKLLWHSLYMTYKMELLRGNLP